VASRSLAQRCWYNGLRIVCRMLCVVLFRIRNHGREHIPTSGGVLVLANHQSHFDPVLIGQAFNRRLNYLARDTLFGFAPFRWLIRSLDAIPIDREGLGMAGLKETLRRLKQEELVLIFPEGTRTRDGEVHALKPGFSALARRGTVWLLPVALDGAYQAWPRRQMLPGLAVVDVQIGPPIRPEEIARYNERELVAEIERRIRACHAAARAQRRRARGSPPEQAPQTKASRREPRY
jgi:1-acyl-sn-glycerol-3-phosphate acyltransferase